MITGKINCTAIEKARLFKGEKGTYLDIVLIETPNGQYGDYMIVQAVTKEERLAGVKGPILGNAKILGQKPAAAPAQKPAAAKPAAQEPEGDIPF